MDCLLWIADWVHECRGVDPAEEWRGTYSVKFGASRIIYRAGGVVPLVDGAMVRCGFMRTAEPKVGDIAVAKTMGGECGAVVTGDGFSAFLGDHSVVVLRVPLLAAWSL